MINSGLGLAVYSPDLLGHREIVELFVARRALLARLLEDLRATEGRPQHHLLVGPRGMGKTTLLRRLRFAIEDDRELRKRWLPLTFPEEQYNVSRLSDLWVNCLDALAFALEQEGDKTGALSIEKATDALPDDNEARRADQALKVLRGFTKSSGRRLALLVDNADLVLDRLADDHWKLRKALSQEPVVFIGASTAVMSSTFEYGSAFYDYLKIDELRPLNEEETKDLLARLAEVRRTPSVARIVEHERGRIRALHLLAAGNPRTLVLLFQVLAQEERGGVVRDLAGVVDLSTPYYRSRFEALSPQARQIVDALALLWDPATAGDVAGMTRLDVNTVSAQLDRLAKLGEVAKVPYPPGSKTGFQIAERFFNVWYLVRAGRHQRRRVVWLVEFLRRLYATQLEGDAAEDARSTARTEERAQVLAHLREGEWEEAEPTMSSLLSDPAFVEHDAGWAKVLELVRASHDAGYAPSFASLLDRLGLSERWRPLREAVRALVEGMDALLRLAPEVRQAAEEVLVRIGATERVTAKRAVARPQPAPRPAPKRTTTRRPRSRPKARHPRR